MTTSGDERALIAAAAKAAQAAYAPYSRFCVGAALRTSNGQIVTGCNVENASFGLTICAERVAVGAAVAIGERSFAAIAICAPGAAMPCGACRQVLHEFNPELLVVVCDPAGTELARAPLTQLLPHSFGPAQFDI